MKKILAGILVVTCAGCGLTSKGQRFTFSAGFEGYDDHRETVVVRPDEKPFICKLWSIEGMCTGQQTAANAIGGS